MSPRLRDPAGPAGEAADMAIAAAKIAKQAAAKIPQPDPRDDPTFQIRQAAERIAGRSSRPRRNRWRPLVELDQRLAALHARAAELDAQVTALDNRTAEQTDSDRLALARWVAAGEQGAAPAPAAPALEVERANVRAVRDAVNVAIDEALDARVRHVEKHRTRMVEQARGEVEASRAKYLALVSQLRVARTDLLEARATETWAQLYPHELATSLGGNEVQLALGLLAPVKSTIGVTHQLSAEQVLQGLEADANTIAERLSPEQRKELGTATEPTPETAAMWHSDEGYQQWVKEQREKLNEMARWTLPGDLRQLGEEMRED